MTGADQAVGIFGGTFDPVHYGHLRSALELVELLGLQEMRLIPGRQPPHRGAPDGAPEARLEMLRLAAADQPGFVVDSREMRRQGPSYTVDTLEELRAEFGPERPLVLCLGVDAFLGLGSWHRWEAIPRLAHVVVMHRPGWHLEQSKVKGCEDALALLAERQVETPAALTQAAAGLVLLLAVTRLEISATDIRSRMANGLSGRYLLPDSVCDYIRRHGLYRAATYANER